MRSQMGKIYKILKSYIYKPNPNAILLFGLNKSGTSATINLLARRAGISCFHDFVYYLGGWEDVLEGNIELKSYINRYSYAFSKDLIRFPMSPKEIDLAATFFKLDKYVVTVRNPADNIKSILSRLKLPGDLEKLDLSTLNLHLDWIKMLSKKPNYIDSLIQCWLESYNQLEFMNSNHCVLFKYEDFIKNKIGYITEKVEKLGLEAKYPIDHLVDVQYQPKGTEMSNLDFFGRKNLDKIISSTYILASKLGYVML